MNHTHSSTHRPGAVVAGAYLRTLRTAAGLTPQQAAARAHCSFPTIRQIETGRASADSGALARLADLYLPAGQAVEVIALASAPGGIRDSGSGWSDRLAALEHQAGTIILASSNIIPAPLRSPACEQVLRERGDAPPGSRALPLTHDKNVQAYLHEDAISSAGPPEAVREQAAHLLRLAATADIRIIPRGPGGVSEHLPLPAGHVYGQLWLRPTPIHTEEFLTYGVSYPHNTAINGLLDLCRHRAATRDESRDILRGLSAGTSAPLAAIR
ncbi:Scr1 family TA system antitoxin-like transcriptional regulator [Streptomyces tsukubensis]|uniref:Scr1 family TA system antitoxin-like transcriptional regulator n=1 Tax=Streptomyces tsukubensis TaxID=83656 RepID=UPI0034509C57